MRCPCIKQIKNKFRQARSNLFRVCFSQTPFVLVQLKDCIFIYLVHTLAFAFLIFTVFHAAALQKRLDKNTGPF